MPRRALILAVGLMAGCGSDAVGGPATVPPVTVPPATVPPLTTSPVTASRVTTSPETTSPVPTTALVDTPASWDGSWIAVEGIVDAVPVAIVGQITLTIAGSTFSGTAACNSYEYRADIAGDTVTFADGFVTSMGCDAELMGLEELYLGTIGPIAAIALSGGSLTLTTDRAVWSFTPAEAVADAPFVGTRWVASELVGEFGVAHVVGMDAAFIVFAEDGTLRGSTGCRELGGTWAGDVTWVTTDVTTDGTCSGALVDVDETLLGVLAAGFAPQIDDRHLVAASDGSAVGFVAG